jgi:FAD binding domain
VRYLIGSDGGRSFVRHTLGIEFPGKTLGVRAVVADIVLTGLGREAWHRFHDGAMDRQMALCPLAGTELFQLQAPIPLEGDVDLSAAGLTAMVADRTGRDDIRVQSVHWASAYTMNARLADRYRLSRMFLIGDAAHTHPPTGGQGLNTSVQDAYNLGWKLEAVIGGARDALLDSYEEERRPIAADMLGLATKLLDAAKRGELRRGRDVQQLDLGYPWSSLALEKPARSRLIAGDRAPDAPIRGSAGQPMRLFELFKGPALAAARLRRRARCRVAALRLAHSCHRRPRRYRRRDGLAARRLWPGVRRLGAGAPGRLCWSDRLDRCDGCARDILWECRSHARGAFAGPAIAEPTRSPSPMADGCQAHSRTTAFGGEVRLAIDNAFRASGRRRHPRCRFSPVQAKAQSDPARARHDQVEAQEQAQNIEAVDGPARQDQQPEQQGHDAG